MPMDSTAVRLSAISCVDPSLRPENMTVQRSQELDLSRYDTDKIANRYLEWYDRELSHLEPCAKVLELGVKNGGSLLLWRDYFPEGFVAGLDKNLSNLRYAPGDFDRLAVYEGSQADGELLSRIALEHAPDGFDLIVDDASHVGWLSRMSFEHLFDRHLKPGGVYVVEDWTTGYWDDWSDGRTHHPRSWWATSWYSLLKAMRIIKSTPSNTHPYGLVGFVKELVDEQGASDRLRGLHANSHGRASKFTRTCFYPSVCFVHKRL